MTLRNSEKMKYVAWLGASAKDADTMETFLIF